MRLLSIKGQKNYIPVNHFLLRAICFNVWSNVNLFRLIAFNTTDSLSPHQLRIIRALDTLDKPVIGVLDNLYSGILLCFALALWNKRETPKGVGMVTFTFCLLAFIFNIISVLDGERTIVYRASVLIVQYQFTAFTHFVSCANMYVNYAGALVVSSVLLGGALRQIHHSQLLKKKLMTCYGALAVPFILSKLPLTISFFMFSSYPTLTFNLLTSYHAVFECAIYVWAY
jgi:hypothetical protein